MLALLIQLAVIITTATVTAVLFQKIGQPKVIGEMFAGIILGPSLLGWVAPQLSAAIFPTASLGYIGALSQIGIAIYMFLVGLAMDPAELREHRRALVLVSHVSIAARSSSARRSRSTSIRASRRKASASPVSRSSSARR